MRYIGTKKVFPIFIVHIGLDDIIKGPILLIFLHFMISVFSYYIYVHLKVD